MAIKTLPVNKEGIYFSVPESGSTRFKAEPGLVRVGCFLVHGKTIFCVLMGQRGKEDAIMAFEALPSPKSSVSTTSTLGFRNYHTVGVEGTDI